MPLSRPAFDVLLQNESGTFTKENSSSLTSPTPELKAQKDY